MKDPISILKGMTLKQKLAQLTQLNASFFSDGGKSTLTGPLSELGILETDVALIGTVLGVEDANSVIEIQKKHMEEDPNHIPLLFMLDVIHGFVTIFPIPLALGCTWDIEIVQEAMSVAAKECYATGIGVTFSPMVDLVRDARWGRVMESTGEDPYLNSLFAKAFVLGYQGNSLEDKGTVASCAKHFAGYGAAEGGRDYNTVDIGIHMLREYYFPAYQAAVDAGCKLVMSAFNIINGIPAAANKWLLKDILRDEWNFDGVVISDWEAVRELICHGVAEDDREAAFKALTAGLEIEMMSSSFLKYGEKLVADGELDERIIDDAVLRVLKLKKQLGLFENPYRGADIEAEKTLHSCPEHRELALRVAEKSMVLLKNNGILPLSSKQKMVVIGPYAEARHLLGAWACRGREKDVVSLKEGMLAHISPDNITFVQTSGGFTDENAPPQIKIDDIPRLAMDADVILLALGEHPNMSGEAGSRAFIRLPHVQEELADVIFNLGMPTAVVLFNGRPLDISAIDRADAILEAWFPGTEGGIAVANVLFGSCNPEGRLTMSFPRAVGQLPVYYNHLNTGRPYDDKVPYARYSTGYLDLANSPLYPFGYGLSYTSFQYSKLILNKSQIMPDETITASVTVKNTGERTGTETVQLYLRDISGSLSRPVKELKAFQKVQLDPGCSRTIHFKVTQDMLKYHTANGAFCAEPGVFLVFAGSDSSTNNMASFKFTM